MINPSLIASESYNRIYEKLLQKYDVRELAENWKPWYTVQPLFSYYKNKNYPKTAKCIGDIELSDEFTTTTVGLPFLRLN